MGKETFFFKKREGRTWVAVRESNSDFHQTDVEAMRTNPMALTTPRIKTQINNGKH